MAIPTTRRIYDEGRLMIIRAARLRDMPACADIVNTWIDATDWMPRVHSPDEVAEFYRDTVFERFEVFVADRDEQIAGMVALAPDNMVSALYVHADARRQGVGKALLDRAKREATGPVQLWTFVANRAAQAFYKHEGFMEVRRTEGDNEEQLPDILYVCRVDGVRATP
ncbi:L-amino acid N-acyltransferase YncA [Phyllobacterium sp. YR620]|uniref:GNAT family N-acetyltransferase n=1 Tax=Phyllobacterium sp. YR620 TaxID=1881066 RepID=UPI000880F9B7|nr:GNAT family N-acetyltransferase [Phyllobacterium sp. YR620]SDP33303.1 L-amino acid N-acyltransferase YncA [Phyllobacterium sp. YR620]